MNFPKVNPTKTKAWNALKAHFSEMKQVKMQDLFAQDESRAEAFSLQWNDFYIDYSKNRLSSKTKSLLLDLAKEVKLDEAIKAQFSGSSINQTENRAVLHTALRDFDAMKPEVKETLQNMKTFSEEIISGSWKGCTGKAITDIVNIGVGGSDLGPKMASEALQYYKNHLQTHYISNVDGDHVFETIKNLNPETTLFIIVSKSFSTLETLTNATTIREWFLKNLSEKDIEKHFVAVTANQTSAVDFGIKSTNIFPMWDWVGGRFSLWSAVGLSISLALGYEQYESLLEGAYKMDKHFKTASFNENIPVISALLTVWYNNFFNAESEAIIPYTQYLNQFATYLQQGIMESNGKSVDRSGSPVTYETGTIIWGEPGTNSQHAFFQLIHQGTKLIPADFIGFVKSLHGNSDHHDKLMSNYFAQTEALMNGKTEKEVLAELKGQGLPDDKIKELLPFKIFEGNKPTTSILINELTPESLGKLIAMYEHKIFVQGIIWNIYSYDQFGVELGKQLAKTILKELNNDAVANLHDASTQQLVDFYKNNS